MLSNIIPLKKIKLVLVKAFLFRLKVKEERENLKITLTLSSFSKMLSTICFIIGAFAPCKYPTNSPAIHYEK